MRELLSLISSFVNFPTWLRNSIYILSALAVLSIGLAFSPIVALIVAIGVLLVLICLGIYAFLLKQRRDRQQAALGGGLEQNALATPRGINDPARRPVNRRRSGAATSASRPACRMNSRELAAPSI
jgi:hypothetical protein